MTTTNRTPGLAKAVTKVLESVGVLNKGSADGTKDENSTVDSNALNATRVGGLAAAIAIVGAAALTLYNVDKSKDNVAIVVIAYASTGFIVGAALIAVAIMISADVKARAHSACCQTSPPDSDTENSNGKPTVAATPKVTTANESDQAAGFVKSWTSAMNRLGDISTELVAVKDRNGLSELWLRANATTGIVKDVHPPSRLADEQAFLSAGQDRSCDLLKELITASNPNAEEIRGEIARIILKMREQVNSID